MNSDKIPVLILVPNSTTFYNTHFFELINKTKVFDTSVILFNEDDAGISALVRKINSEYLSEGSGINAHIILFLGDSMTYNWARGFQSRFDSLYLLYGNTQAGTELMRCFRNALSFHCADPCDCEALYTLNITDNKQHVYSVFFPVFFAGTMEPLPKFPPEHLRQRIRLLEEYKKNNDAVLPGKALPVHWPPPKIEIKKQIRRLLLASSQ